MPKIVTSLVFSLLVFAGEASAQSCATYPYNLQNNTTADATQVMANFNCAARTYQPTFTGPATFTTTSGSNVLLDKPGGAAATFTESGVPKFLVEDDTAADNSLGFYYWNGSSWTKRVHFKTNGYVGINVDPSYPLDVVGPGGASGAVDIEGANSIVYSNYWAANTGSTITAQAGGGSCTYSGGSGWSCSSDERLKKNIARLRSESGLAAIGRLHPVSYDLKQNYQVGPQMGFLAQEVRTVFPQAVSFEKGATAKTAPNGTYLLNYTALIPPAVLAIQQLDARSTIEREQVRKLQAANDKLQAANDAQETEIKSLRAELTLLEKRIGTKIAAN